MTPPYSNYLLAVEHPELAVLDLLGHVLRAAHEALAVVHPEIDTSRNDLGPLEEQCHIAMLIGIDLRDLQQRLTSYRAAVEAAVEAEAGDDDEQIDLPF